MTATAALAPEVRLGGTLLADRWLEALTEIRAERGLRTVGAITLRFTDPGYALASTSAVALGTAVEVGVVGGGTLARGSVTGLAVEQHDGLPPELVVTAHDGGRRLAGSPVVRTFTGQPFHEVLKAVVTAAGLEPRLPHVASPPQQHVLQVGTDLEFVDELADRLNWDWWIDDRTLVAAVPGTGPTLTRALGADLQEFSASAVEPPGAVRVHGWDPWTKQAVVSEPARVGAATTMSTSPLLDGFTGRGKDAGGNGAERHINVVRTVTNSQDADEVAGTLRDAIARAAITATGRGPADPVLQPGVTLTVTNAGPVSGTYHVSRVEHVYRRTGFYTRFVAGDRSPATLVDLLGGREDVGRGRADAGGRFYGLMSGIVTDLKDPQRRGRARVRFPAFSATDTSDWARIATIGAGGGRGLVVIPEVDDEVLVAFEGGDLRRPVILGGLHNGKDKIPQHDVERGVQQRRFTSRLGHVIELADGADPRSQHVLIALAGGDESIRLGKDRTDVRLPAKHPMTITVGTTTIAVDAGGGLTIEAGDITVKARKKLTLSGSEVEVKAAKLLKADAEVLIARGTGMASVESDGVTVVKGKAVAIN